MLTVVALVGMLVMSSAMGPVAMSEPAGAVSTDEVCNYADMYLNFMTLGLAGVDCSEEISSDEFEAMQSADANQTWMDYYVAWHSTENNVETIRNTVESYSQDTRTSAFIKAENETVDLIWKDADITTINNTAEAAVNDYYTASQEMRLLEAWNQQALDLEYMLERIKQENEITDEDLFGGETTNNGGYNAFDEVNIQTYNHTLMNGTNVTAYRYELVMEDRDDTGYHARTYLEFDNRYNTKNTGMNVWMEPPPSSGMERYYFDHSDYTDLWDRWQVPQGEVDANRVMIVDNAKAWAKTLNDAEAAGTVDVSNYVSPYLMAQEWSTDYNTTGYWSYAVAKMAAAGWETPNLNDTSHIDVIYGDEFYQGMLFSSNPPENNTWENKATYNASNMTGKVLFVDESGNITELTGEFTIDDMQNKDGNTVDNTTTVEYVYESTNTTEFEAMQEQVLNLTQEIEDLEEQIGTDASGGGGISLSWVSDLVYSLTGMNLPVAEATIVAAAGGIGALWLLKSLLLV